MYVVTLLTDPVTGGLTGTAIRELARSWAVREPRWLAAGVAVEADLDAEVAPADEPELWERWQDRGVDLVLQPAANRRKQVLLADMDSTMISQECIDELAAHAGVGNRVAAITARAMNGELDFGAALAERVELLNGLPESIVAEVLAQRITLAPGGAELLTTMRSGGAYTALVSGGFTAFTGPVAEQLGFDEHRANTLGVADGVLTGEVVPPVVGREAKVAALLEITSAHGLTPDDVIAVGDGANDLGMLQLAGTGVALHATEAVASQAKVRVNHGDLTALLFLQGYTAAEFVRP